MSKRAAAFIISMVMATTLITPISYAQEENAVLDGETINGITQEELD